MGKRRLVSNHKRVACRRRTSLPCERLMPRRLTSSTSEKTESYCSRKIIRAFVRSYGESSTETLSPGTILMKCLRILPEMCARTLRWPGRSTRNIVPGKTCVTVPSVMICSSFAIARRIYQRAHVAQGYVYVTHPPLPADSMHTGWSASRFNGTGLVRVMAGIREAPHVSTMRQCGEAHPAL